MENIKIYSSFDNEILHCSIYVPQNPIAIIQIVHGMMEHQKRYEEFAKFLCDNNFIVITSDIRGHGPNCELKNLGFMGDKKQDEALVIDQISITEYMKNRFPNTDIYLFGHSMGTIIARNIIQKHESNYKKIILSGAPAPQGIAGMGVFLANVIGLLKGNYHKSKLLQSMTIGPFTKSVKNYKTKNDWLSYNDENVINYNNDQFCGFPFTVSGYKGLLKSLANLGKYKKYNCINNELPILFVSGKDDPCTLGEKGLKKSIKTLNKAKYTNIKSIVYDNMRHEILQEKDKYLVYQTILQFLK